ncbi:MAG: SRPBCC family protein [Nitrospiraceae bacterium]
MNDPYLAPFDKNLDLVLERQIDIPKEVVWRALVEPDLLKKWFCPKPWQTVDCRVDLRPGGEFYTVMQSPDGDKFPSTGCFLDVVTHTRLVWTSALLAGFRPAAPATEQEKACAEIVMTCIITLQGEGKRTRYNTRVLHGSPQQTQMHLEMGFNDGWNTCLTQMIELLTEM